MTSSTATQLNTATRRSRVFASPGWVWGGIIGVLALWLFDKVIERTFLIATDSGTVRDGIEHLMRGHFQPDWSHGLLLPLISIYYVVQNRQTLGALWRGETSESADMGSAARLVAAVVGVPSLLLAYLTRHAQSPIGRGVCWFSVLLVAVAGAAFVLLPRLARPGAASAMRRRVSGLLRLAGLVLFFGGTFSFGWWLGPGRNDMLQGYSMIIALFGLTLACLGPALVKPLAFPIFYLLLAFKVSDRYWDLLADKLRVIVAHAAQVVLTILSLNVDLAGSRITIFPAHGAPIPLDVVDACSGLRSLMAYIALGAAIAWLSQRATWQRWIMLLMTIPVAVVINIGRLSVLGVLSLRWPFLAQGQAHIFIGTLMLIPALLLLLLVGWVLDHLVIQDDVPGRSPAPPVPSPARPDAVILRRWLVAGAGGAVLAGLLGVCYLLAMTIMRPQDMFGGRLSLGLAEGLLIASGVLVLPAMFLARRALAGDSSRGLAGRSGALGLATGVLLICVLGINVVVAANKWVTFKLPVPLRHEFVEIPAELGPWHRCGDFPFSAEEREILGPWAVNWLYERSDRPDLAPSGVHLTYYTGIVDTVPHVPERCELAGGAVEQDRRTVLLHLGGPGYHQRPGDPSQTWYAPSRLTHSEIAVPQTVIRATDSQFVNKDNQRYSVIYFFVANGGYFANPDEVRANGFNPRDRYNYYCKVQMRVVSGADPDSAAAQASRLLSSVMPEVLACLPDWDQVVKGQWPPARR